MSRLALQHYTSKATDAPPPAANTVLFCSTEIALISPRWPADYEDQALLAG